MFITKSFSDKATREGQQLLAVEALSMLLDRGLTVTSYKIIAEKLNDKVGYTLMPPYSHVQMEKINAQPENIIGDKNNVQVPLKDVLQHTVKRICDQEDVEDVMNDLARKNGNKLHCNLSFKFGKYQIFAHNVA